MGVLKELGKGRFCSNEYRAGCRQIFPSKESIIAYQGVTMSDSFAVHMRTLHLASWFWMVFKELPVVLKKLFHMIVIFCGL
jgi:hypothetical protein